MCPRRPLRERLARLDAIAELAAAVLPVERAACDVLREVAGR
jgi:hypothetical protein